MTDERDDIRALRLKVADLEARLELLAEKQTRDVNALMDCDDILDKHRKVKDAELADAFDRIINLELHSFPHLATDIAELNRILGDGDEKVYNPFDFRDRRKFR